MTNKTVFLKLFVAFVFTNSMMFSQKTKEAKPSDFVKYLTMNSKDSLNGFDENKYKAVALSEGFFGEEYHVFMLQKKREFINTKYNLSLNIDGGFASPFGEQNGGNQMGAKGPGGGNNIMAAPCVNEDFELNTFAGWTITSGQNNNSCTYNTCPTPGSPEAWIRTTPWADANFPGGFIPNSPLGGTRVAQLNNNVAQLGRVTRIRQTFPVTPTNVLFQFAYCAAFNPAHPCCSQPFLNINIRNCQNVLLACPQISVVAPGPGCNSPAPGFTTVGSVAKCLWQVKSLDLTPYLGSCVTIEVTVGDCSGWAHWGYVYFDAICGPMNMVVNNQVFPAGTQATTVAACGANTATITAPPGLQPYLWNGPVGSGVTNNPNQTFTTQTSGQYTLTMNPPGSCTPIVKYVQVNFAGSPTAGLVYTNMCNIFTFTNTGSPAPAVQTFSFVGPGAVPGFTTTSLTNTVVFPVQGQYTVTQVVTNTAGCTASVQTVINAPIAPNVAFAVNNPTQCLQGNAFTFTAADPTGVHSYSFNPGGPPIGNTPTYGPVTFTAAGTYTVTHSVTAGGCTSFSTMVITVNPPPTPTVSNNGPNCINTSILLTASGGTSYAWSGPLGYVSAIQNPTIVNAQINMSGQYSVIVTSAAGCTAMATTDVTVYAIPSPTITSNSPVCVGNALSFTASGGVNYVWSGPNGFTSNIANPVINNVTLPAGGIYTLVAGAGQCTSAATGTVIINPLPNAQAGSNSPVCLNQPLNLNANGGTIYIWTGPGAYGSNQQNPVIAVASMSNAGTYTVTVTDNNLCTNTATTAVTINPLPNVVVNNPTACVNSPLQFVGNGAASYAWSGPNGFVSNQGSPVIPVASLNDNGQYVLIGTSAQGCTNSAISNPSVTANPTANISSNSPVCFGGSLTLNGAGGVNYLWNGPNNFTSAVNNNVINNVSMQAAGAYTLLVTANTCTSMTVFNVVVNQLPTLNIQTNNPICKGSPINFTATGASLYQWSGPANFAGNGPMVVIALADSVHNGIYTLVGTDNNGCVNSTTTSILVKPLPLVSTLGSTVCIGHTASLSVSGGVSYSWEGPNGFTSSQSNINLPNLNESQAGPYYVNVTGANGCTLLAAAIVTNHPKPLPIASNNGPVCVNGKVTFTASGGLVYQWTGPNGFLSNSQNTSLEEVSSLACAGTYTLGVIDSKGCQAYTTTQLLVRPLPTASLASSVNKHCIPFCSDFSLNSSSKLKDVSWISNGGGNVNGNKFYQCFTQEGSYVLRSEFKDEYGCANSNSFVIEAYPIPTADFHVAPGEPKEKELIEFTDASFGKELATWTWYFNQNNKFAMTRYPNYVFDEPGSYAVALVVGNKWGCKDTIVKPVIVAEDFNIYVPNAFSPNGDGVNDTFQPKGYGIKSYQLMVFDRWGERLYQTTDFPSGWDGKYKGETCKDDVYVWMITAFDKDGKKHEFKGTVTLYR